MWQHFHKVGLAFGFVFSSNLIQHNHQGIWRVFVQPFLYPFSRQIYVSVVVMNAFMTWWNGRFLCVGIEAPVNGFEETATTPLTAPGLTSFLPISARRTAFKSTVQFPSFL
ncbi:MAG TPA: hypothetical protein DCW46_01380 [Desulfotomaculum sp.]|nr:hypothetical protein [Desulfotomaculum sp.]